jgi:hypothetical protein
MLLGGVKLLIFFFLADWDSGVIVKTLSHEL